jgi:Dolichyl-phosphate-mannose-protein mannosyltransferase
MNAAAVPTTRTTFLVQPLSDWFAVSRAVATASFIVAVMALAFGLHAAGLSTYGFSEDEINKVRAIEEYRAGHLSANAEHPMLMKLAMLTSVQISDAWNHVAPGAASIAIETAVRLPNALVGAATTGALFAVAGPLFGMPIAMVASMFWAVDVNAIAINRIGKEDTFALFFFLIAVAAYERAKQVGARDLITAQRWYTASGASFGLMLASKYFPQYLGVYALLNAVTDRKPGSNRPEKLRYYGAMLVAFFAANVAVITPATWQYIVNYVHGGTLTHHGYPYAGHLYANTSLLSPDGIPGTFYVEMMATKLPVILLGALVPGLIEVLRRRRERGAILLLIWGGLFLAGYSVASVKFIRYALPLFAVVDLIAAVGVVAGIQWLLRKSWLTPLTRVTVAAAAVTVSICATVAAPAAAGPFFSLSRNAIGEQLAPAGAMFPEETYDYGVREAVSAIAHTAEPGAAIVSDAPAVVAYYVEHGGRTDLRVRSLSAEGLPRDGRASFVILQPEHLTFENQALVGRLRQFESPWREFRAGDAIAARVYLLPRS